MKDLATDLPGFVALRAKFLAMLQERQGNLAGLALDAWNTRSGAEKVEKLDEAARLLHKMSGSAGSFGFPELGKAAARCEALICAHLEEDDVLKTPCPAEIISAADAFVSLCGTCCDPH
ncbi:Hpt domain-containing protein [Roseovarius sp. S4756]|uniref:Hpt domain-containing protein n=1 Tax=Roseovarius maritimus TaxID=3342637 RepID=UPI0037270F67